MKIFNPASVGFFMSEISEIWKSALHSQNQLQIKPSLGEIIWYRIELAVCILNPLLRKHVIYAKQVENFKRQYGVVEVFG